MAVQGWRASPFGRQMQAFIEDVAGEDDGESFRNPPDDLTDDEKTAVRTAIGAAAGSVTLWVGAQADAPAVRDENTLYFFTA